MPRIRITEKGWQGFTGNMGTAVFEDGVADVSELEALRIGSNIEIKRIDDEGEDQEQISPSLDITRYKKLSAEVAEVSAGDEMKLIVPTDGAEAIDAAMAEFTSLATNPEENPESEEAEETEENPTPKTVYTREDLEKIADAQGIKGLREIADPLGLKSTSIVPLIDAILEAQSAS